ncbi:MAG: cation:dicarboxylase symporter family transporter, partial [Ruminococcus sp.]|nr:cation:dicarboxylase symporter family transporter [Ruminococcus sp.]
MSFVKKCLHIYNDSSLILRILIGIAVGVGLAFLVPQAQWIGMIGSLFVSALKAIAPVLVAVLVAGSLCQGSAKLDRRFGLVVSFYLLSTYLASFAAVTASFLFPQTITLSSAVQQTDVAAAPDGIGAIVTHLLQNIFANPIGALSEGNYLGILFWA